MKEVYLDITETHEVHVTDKSDTITISGMGHYSIEEGNLKMGYMLVTLNPELILQMADKIKQDKATYHRNKYLEYITNFGNTPKVEEVTND